MGKNKQQQGKKKKTSSSPKKKDSSSSFFDAHRLQVKSRVRFPDCAGSSLAVPPEELLADVSSGMPLRLLSFKYGLPKDGREAKNQIRHALRETIKDEKALEQLLNKKRMSSYQSKHPSRLASSYIREERKQLLQDLQDPKILDFEIKRLTNTPLPPKNMTESSSESFRKLVSNLSEGSRKEITSVTTILQQCFEGREARSPFDAAGGLPPETASLFVTWLKGLLCGVFREIAPSSKKRKEPPTKKAPCERYHQDSIPSGTSLLSSSPGDDQTPPNPVHKKRRLNEERPPLAAKSLFPTTATKSKGKEKEEAPTEEEAFFNNDKERAFLEEQLVGPQHPKPQQPEHPKPQHPEQPEQQQPPENPRQQAKRPQQPSNQLDLSSDADSKPDPYFWPSEEEEESSQETKADERQDSPTLVDAAADRFVFSVLVSTDSNNAPAEPPNTQEEQTNSSTVVTTTRTTEDKNKDKAEDSPSPASEEEIVFNPEQQQQSDKEKKGEELSAATASMAQHLSEDCDEGHESDATMPQDGGVLVHNGEPPNDLIQETDLNPNAQQPNGTTSQPIEEETKEGCFNSKDQGFEEEEEEEGQESDTTTLPRFNASTNRQPVAFKEMMTPFCILEGTKEASQMNNLYQVSQEATENQSPSSQSITFEQESVALQLNTPSSTKTMPGQKQARAKKKRQDNLSIEMAGWTDPISTTRTRSRNASRVPLFDGRGTAKEEASSRPRGRKGKGRRNRKRQRDDSLTGCDSELCDIDLRLIINHETWSTLLTAEERNRLQLLLPQQDRTNETTLKRALDHNPFLHSTLREYQEFQKAGTFEMLGEPRLAKRKDGLVTSLEHLPPLTTLSRLAKQIAEGDPIDVDAYMSFHAEPPQLTKQNLDKLSFVYEEEKDK